MANVLSEEKSVWVSFTKTKAIAPAKTQIMEESNNSIVIEMTVEGMNSEQHTNEGEQFQSLSVPNAGWTCEVGKPKLPVINCLITVPSDHNITIEVEDEEHINLSGYNVYPVPKQVTKNGYGGTAYIGEEFTIDRAFYSTNRFYPSEPVSLSFSGYFRDERLIQVEFHPIRYCPSSQELICYSFIRVRLTYNGASSLVKPLSLSQNLHNIAGNIAMAPPADRDTVSSSASVIYLEELTAKHDADYIIIAPEPFYSDPKLKQLADWRSQYNGFGVVVAQLEKICNGNDPGASIKAFIQYAYDTWESPNSQDGHVRYVLLIGVRKGKLR